LQIYFIFARLCKLQKIFEKKGERIATEDTEGSKGAVVNGGKFQILMLLFAFIKNIIKRFATRFTFVVELYIKVKLIKIIII
jgi:hypothetical protein